HRADLFSLGSVLYAMCTGRPPFRATGSMAVLRRVADDTPTPIRDINPDIPEWLCAIVAKLHAKKPEERLQTAPEVAELLERHLAHLQQPASMPLPRAFPLPVAAPRPVVERRPSRWPAWPMVLLGLGLLIGAIVLLPEVFRGGNVWDGKFPLSI